MAPTSPKFHPLATPSRQPRTTPRRDRIEPRVSRRAGRMPSVAPVCRSSRQDRSLHLPVKCQCAQRLVNDRGPVYFPPMKATRRALRHDVRDGLVRAIMDAEYGPGDRLIEMQIAREYGTSQGPVREALRELEVLGFVRNEPHRGTYVRDSWQRGMLELYQLRGALEEFATRLATPVLDGDASALQAEVDAMSSAAAEGDVEAGVEHSERFHRLIIDASGNRLLSNV